MGPWIREEGVLYYGLSKEEEEERDREGGWTGCPRWPKISKNRFTRFVRENIWRRNVTVARVVAVAAANAIITAVAVCV